MYSVWIICICYTFVLFINIYSQEEKIYEVEHEIGIGVLHLGKHIHGANPVASGTRVNLILWCREEPFPP